MWLLVPSAKSAEAVMRRPALTTFEMAFPVETVPRYTQLVLN